MVDALILSDGTEYPARDISIGDGVVYATTVDVEGTRLARDIDGYGRVQPHDADAYHDDVIVGYDPDYRTHHASAYSASGRGYDDDLAHAYRYGTETAYHDDFRNRPYADAEVDLRTGYTTRYADRDFDADREAVRFGYNRARR